MSGTSLDGLDLICASFEKKDVWEFEIIKATTYSYSDHWKNALAKLHKQNPIKIQKTEDEYVHLMGRNILDFTIVVAGLLTIFLDLMEYEGSNVSFMKVLRMLRVLRPLKAISRNRGMQLVVRCLIASMASIGNVLIVAFVLFFPQTLSPPHQESQRPLTIDNEDNDDDTA